MGSAVLVIMILALFALAIYGLYLLSRIATAYKKIRRLNQMRYYETLLYSALGKAEVEEVLSLIPAGTKMDLLEEVLVRMGANSQGQLRDKIISLYDRLGFYQTRVDSLGKAKLKVRLQSVEYLGKIGDPRAIPHILPLQESPHPELRARATTALERMEKG